MSLSIGWKVKDFKQCRLGFFEESIGLYTFVVLIVDEQNVDPVIGNKIVETLIVYFGKKLEG